MRNIKLTIEYDGKEFHGWQKQPNKLNIQGEIEKAIERITGEERLLALELRKEDIFDNQVVEWVSILMVLIHRQKQAYVM